MALPRLKYVDIFGKKFFDGSMFSYRPISENYFDDFGLYHAYTYPTGTSRFISMAGLQQGVREPPKSKVTWEFSPKARRRYFHYLLSMYVPDELVPFWVVFTFPREFRLNIDLRIDNYKHIIKRFLQKMSREGIDCIGKTEFHRDLYPHYHCILIISREVLKSGSFAFKNNDQIFLNYGRLSDWLSHLWIDSCATYGGLYANIFFAQKWHDHCCNLSPLDDWASSASYLASYTTKNKSYQNIIPDGWRGLRFTNKSLRNYSSILKSRPPVKYFIDENTFTVAYRRYEDECKKRYGREYNERKFKKNGFWLKGVDGYLLAHNMGIDKVVN